MSNDYLETRIAELQDDIDQLKYELLELKKSIPDNLSRKLKDHDEKLDELEENISDLQNP